jgi:phage baseplate assembly protein gpV
VRSASVIRAVVVNDITGKEKRTAVRQGNKKENWRKSLSERLFTHTLYGPEPWIQAIHKCACIQRFYTLFI